MPSSTDKNANTIAKNGQKGEFPQGLWVKCNGCDQPVFQNVLEEANQVCPYCGYHYPISAWKRIELLADGDSFVEMFAGLRTCDPIGFASDGSYPKKVQEAMAKTGMNEAVICGRCHIAGVPSALAVMDFRFMGASMGSVVGEKITRLVEYATRAHRALVIVTASGGARMQEGILSLMQMAKTSAAVKRFSEHGGLYIACLTHPTTGGVSASFATLADITLAEPGALIGFAGPRVIEQTIGQKLPQGFQHAEYLEEHGFVDQIVERKDMREVLSRILKLHDRQKKEKKNLLDYLRIGRK